MSWPEDNGRLRELRRRWEEDQFGVYGVYGVEESVEEASAHLAMYDERRLKPWDEQYDPHGPPDRNRPQTANNEASRVFDRRFNYKTCHVCNMSRRNDPCDDCYAMVRDAARWTDTRPGTIDVYPCAMCGLEIRATICTSCMDVMLR